MKIPEWQSRTALLLGEERLEKLSRAHVLVAGLGGVGAYTAELLCRSGVGRLTIVDGDVIDEGNRNRQLPALKSTEGRRKTDVIYERLKDINPNAEIIGIYEYLKDERMVELLSQPYDYVVDAIDTLSPKVYFIKICHDKGLKIISSMGSGARLDPSLVQIADISKSFNCALARAIRKRLHRLGIRNGVKVVFSPEDSFEKSVLAIGDGELPNKKSVTGTISYMPAVFGCFCASVVIREIAGITI